MWYETRAMTSLHNNEKVTPSLKEILKKKKKINKINK